MNQLTTIPAEKATLVDIRTDNKRFPRLHSYQREEAIMQMNMIIMMAFQFRGQQADAQTIIQMSSSHLPMPQHRPNTWKTARY